MNDWKELKKHDLPHDILTGGYEFMIDDEIIGFVHRRDRVLIFENLIMNDGQYRYRKPEPKAPSHEEIMTLWWKTVENVWKQVDTYNAGYDTIPNEPIYIFNGCVEDGVQITAYDRYRVTADWFIGKKSAKIPPEADNER